MVSGLVSVVLVLGSVAVDVAGGEVLKATQVPGTFADGVPVSTGTGVHLYILMAGVLFVLAAVPAITLTTRLDFAHGRGAVYYQGSRTGRSTYFGENDGLPSS
jgi:hypothetical protein